MIQAPPCWAGLDRAHGILVRPHLSALLHRLAAIPEVVDARVLPWLTLLPLLQCGEEGHIARDCPNPDTGGGGMGGR